MNSITLKNGNIYRWTAETPEACQTIQRWRLSQYQYPPKDLNILKAIKDVLIHADEIILVDTQTKISLAKACYYLNAFYQQPHTSYEEELYQMQTAFALNQCPIQPPPIQVYVVIIRDRHEDVKPVVFLHESTAITFAKEFVRSKAPNPVPMEDHTLTPAMKEAGWIFYDCWTTEGDCVWVIPTTIQDQS